MASPRTRKHERVDPELNADWAEWLARERWGWLRGVAYRARVGAEDIDDIVQAALADFLRAFPGPDAERPVLAYVARCVESQARNARRRFARKESRLGPLPEQSRNDLAQTSEPVTIEDPTSTDPLDAVIAAEELAARAARLGELPADQAAVILLAAAGYSTSEIAAIRGLSERQVRKRIEKANRHLRG